MDSAVFSPGVHVHGQRPGRVHRPLEPPDYGSDPGISQELVRGSRDQPARAGLIFVATIDLCPHAGLERTGFEVTAGARRRIPGETGKCCNACALAELWVRPPQRGSPNLVAVTVSRGYQRGHGHERPVGARARPVLQENLGMWPVADGPQCRCGNRGCWETLASNSAAVRYYIGATSDRKGERLPKCDLAMVLLAKFCGWPSKAMSRPARRWIKWRIIWGWALPCWSRGWLRMCLVVVGEVTPCLGSTLRPIVAEAVQHRSFTHAGTRILPADSEAQPRLWGTDCLGSPETF